MQLNMTTDYAIRTLVCLFQKDEGALLRADDIVAEMKIPYNYLHRVMRSLKQAGLIDTVRGQYGGYRLTQAAQEVRLYDVLKLYEPEKLHRSLEDSTSSVWDESKAYPFSLLFEILQERLDHSLKSLTVKELAAATDKESLQNALDRNRTTLQEAP